MTPTHREKVVSLLDEWTHGQGSSVLDDLDDASLEVAPAGTTDALAAATERAEVAERLAGYFTGEEGDPDDPLIEWRGRRDGWFIWQTTETDYAGVGTPDGAWLTFTDVDPEAATLLAVAPS